MANQRDEEGPVEGRDRYNGHRLPDLTGWSLFHLTGAALCVVVAYLAVQVFINTGRISSSETWHEAHEKLDDVAFARIDKELMTLERIQNEKLADTRKGLEDRLGDRIAAVEKASLAQFAVVATQLSDLRVEMQRQTDRMGQIDGKLGECLRDTEKAKR